MFSDSSTVDLPTDRGPQHTALASVVGARAADAWRDLVDDADDTWQLVRRAGLEAEADLSSPLFADPRTVETEARRMPDERVAELVRSVAGAGLRPGRDPVLAALPALRRAAVRSVGGDPRGRPAAGPRCCTGCCCGALPTGASTYGGASRRRLSTTAASSRTAVTSTRRPSSAPSGTPITRRSGAGRRRPSRSPVVSGLCASAPVAWRSSRRARPRRTAPRRTAPLELVQHAASGTTTTWTLPGRTVVSTGAPGDGGLRWRGPATARAFHPLADQEVWYAGSSSVGGAEPWARLLTGALATYRVHEQLTGDDIRPSNKAYRP